MIEEYAVVERICGDRMDLRVTSPNQCDRCAVRGSCYAQPDLRENGDESGEGRLLSVPREQGMEVSDAVRVTITNTSILGLSSLVYGVPLVGLLAGIFSGYYGFFARLADAAKTLASLGAGLVVMGLCAFFVRWAGRRITAKVEYRTVHAAPTTPAGL